MSSTLHQSSFNPLRRALTGATLGVIVAGGMIVVGLLRVLAAVIVGLLVGIRPHFGQATWQDSRPLAYYVVGFAIAGTLVGVLSPWLRRSAAVYAAMAAGGMVVMTLIVAADKGLRAAEPADWILVVVLGATFGGAAAWGWLRGTSNASRRTT
jgi:peptidoglycan/LPS O-acetylase OafA/YrhL